MSRLVHDGKRYIWEGGYDTRMIPKEARFRWNPTNRYWWTDDIEKAAKLAAYAEGPTKVVLEAALNSKKEALEASRAASWEGEIPAPADLSYLPFQKAGISFAMARENTLIADQMGLGKTIQAIGVINADPTIKRVLVISPASLKLNWQRELEKWLVRPLSVGIAYGKNTRKGVPSWPETDIVVINYDILKKHVDKIHALEWEPRRRGRLPRQFLHGGKSSSRVRRL
jgi:SWI/SNF-related matrix-associated actin-dependent regulator of chromatin subfamily A-like protein 1